MVFQLHAATAFALVTEASSMTFMIALTSASTTNFTIGSPSTDTSRASSHLFPTIVGSSSRLPPKTQSTNTSNDRLGVCMRVKAVLAILGTANYLIRCRPPQKREGRPNSPCQKHWRQDVGARSTIPGPHELAAQQALSEMRGDYQAHELHGIGLPASLSEIGG